MAGTAFPRFLLWAPLGVAEAATVAASQTPPPSGDSAGADSSGVDSSDVDSSDVDSSDVDSSDTSGVPQPVAPTNEPPPSIQTQPATQPSSAADSTAARADSTKTSQGFASEPPETLRYVPPSDLPAGPPPSVAGTHAPPGPPVAEADRPYGPMPKGGAASGNAPKERVGFLGLHPAAIILGLVVVHVLIVRAVTH
jgi:hypothetical protein